MWANHDQLGAHSTEGQIAVTKWWLEEINACSFGFPSTGCDSSEGRGMMAAKFRMNFKE